MINESELKGLAQTVLSSKKIFIVSVFIFALVFIVVALRTEVVYRAEVLLVPAETSRSGSSGTVSSALGQLGGVASLAGLNLNSSDTSVEESLAILRSRDFTSRFIEQHHLLSELLVQRWSLRSLLGLDRSNDIEARSARAFRTFDTKVRTVTRDKKTGLVDLQVDWKDRHMAARWANALAVDVNELLRQRAISQAEVSLGYLRSELGRTTDIGIRDAIYRLIEKKTADQMLANVTREYAFRVVDSAQVPSDDEPVGPRPWMIALAGPFVGMIVAFLVVLYWPSRRNGGAAS